MPETRISPKTTASKGVMGFNSSPAQSAGEWGCKVKQKTWLTLDFKVRIHCTPALLRFTHIMKICF